MEETLFEALGLENYTDEMRRSITKIGYKCCAKLEYTRSDAVLELLKALDIEDTPQNRLLAAHAMSFGESMNEMQHELSILMDSLGD